MINYLGANAIAQEANLNLKERINRIKDDVARDIDFLLERGHFQNVRSIKIRFGWVVMLHGTRLLAPGVDLIENQLGIIKAAGELYSDTTIYYWFDGQVLHQVSQAYLIELLETATYELKLLVESAKKGVYNNNDSRNKTYATTQV